MHTSGGNGAWGRGKLKNIIFFNENSIILFFFNFGAADVHFNTRQQHGTVSSIFNVDEKNWAI